MKAFINGKTTTFARDTKGKTTRTHQGPLRNGRLLRSRTRKECFGSHPSLLSESFRPGKELKTYKTKFAYADREGALMRLSYRQSRRIELLYQSSNSRKETLR